MADTQNVDRLDFLLPPEMDLLAAEALRASLIELLNKSGDLSIDGGEVVRMSTPCVEVLLAAATAFSDSGRGFEVRQPSPSLCDAFDTLGLADRIELWRAS